MVTVIGSHQVKDFAAWKKAFDSEEPKRYKVGLRLLGVYTKKENPNDVTFIFETTKPELIDKVLKHPTFQENMKKAGVVGSPEIHVLHRR
jgi:hypothetical protein